MKVKSNAYVQDDQRWDADSYKVKSGDTVTLRDKSTEGQPHTLSLIKKLPKTPGQIMGCEACGPLMAAHEANMETGEVAKELVEAGGDGFDTGGDKTTAGDSIFLPPKGKVTFKVTAKKGTTLNFVCAVHPWMLGDDQGLLERAGWCGPSWGRPAPVVPLVRGGRVEDALRDAVEVRPEHHVGLVGVPVGVHGVQVPADDPAAVRWTRRSCRSRCPSSPGWPSCRWSAAASCRSTAARR